MLLVWHGTWKRHVYEEPVVVVDNKPQEDEVLLLVPSPLLYKLESVIITHENEAA